MGKMNSTKPLKGSRSWKRVSTGSRALANRLSQLRPLARLKKGRRLVQQYTDSQISLECLIFWPLYVLRVVSRHLLATAVGIGLLVYGEYVLFDVRLFNSLRELRMSHHGPIHYWSIFIGVSLAIAAWVVGGAATHLVYRLWKWSLLYDAGGK